MLAPPRGALFILFNSFHNSIVLYSVLLLQNKPSLPISFPFPLEVCFIFPSSELGNLVIAGQSCYCWAILLLLGNLVIAGQSCEEGGTHKASTIPKLPQRQSFHNPKASPLFEFEMTSFSRHHEKCFSCAEIRTADLPVAEPTRWPFDHGDPIIFDFFKCWHSKPSRHPKNFWLL